MLGDSCVEIVGVAGVIAAVGTTEEVSVKVQGLRPSIRVFAGLSPYSG
jgi:hypothetical protein